MYMSAMNMANSLNIAHAVKGAANTAQAQAMTMQHMTTHALGVNMMPAQSPQGTQWGGDGRKGWRSHRHV